MVPTLNPDGLVKSQTLMEDCISAVGSTNDDGITLDNDFTGWWFPIALNSFPWSLDCLLDGLNRKTLLFLQLQR